MAPYIRPIVPRPDDTPLLAAMTIADEAVNLHPAGGDPYATTLARVEHCYRRSAAIATSLYRPARPRFRLWSAVRDAWWRPCSYKPRDLDLRPAEVLNWAASGTMEPEPRHSVSLRILGWMRGDE